MQRLKIVAVVFLAALAVLAAHGLAVAQEPSAPEQEAPSTTGTTPPATSKAKLEAPQSKVSSEQEHRFWDRTNAWLFAGVAVSRALDYSSTLNMRRRGRQEILVTNDVVDNHAGFAALEAAGVGVSIGASYLLHHYGHHKLERWTSIVHIGLTTTGAVRNYCLKTAHRPPP